MPASERKFVPEGCYFVMGTAALASGMHCSALLPESIAGKGWIEFGDVLARHRIY